MQERQVLVYRGKKVEHSVVSHGSCAEKHPFDVHKGRLRRKIWLGRWYEGLEAASREVLPCREAVGSQFSFWAKLEKKSRTHCSMLWWLMGYLTAINILWCKRAFSQPRRFQSWVRDGSNDRDKEGYQWFNVVMPTIGATQPTGSFISC